MNMLSSAPPALRRPEAVRKPRGTFRMFDYRVETRIAADPGRVFQVVEAIGGENGWYSPAILWHVRGWLDLLAGGVGMRKGRKDPERLETGDPVDFWRVEAIERGRLLRLSAEMKLPGRGWLEFEVVPDGAGGAMLRQAASFDASGAGGLLYWCALYPVHQVIFKMTVRGIARESVRRAANLRR